MPKRIAKAVGFGGANLLVDVRAVQYLLNCVPYRLGGPRRELVIDGFVGPGTEEAIRRFQRFRGAEASGCLYPSSSILEGLLTFDPFPTQELPYTAAKNAGGGDAGAKGDTGETSATRGGAGGDAKSGASGEGSSAGAKGGVDAYGGGSYDTAKSAAGGPATSSSAAGKAGDTTSGAGGGGAKESYQSSDPWGFYNPASPYYGKAGFGPNAAGKGDDGKSASDAGGGAKGESTGTGSNPQDPWGFFDPTSRYYHVAGKAPVGKLMGRVARQGMVSGGDAKSGSDTSSGSGAKGGT